MLTIPKGNLVKNPGFELGLQFWETPQVLPHPGCQNVCVLGLFPHSGLASLCMGFYDQTHPAVVYQDVRVTPGNHYELDFSVSGISPSAAAFQAEVRWLDEDQDDLGVALAIFVPEVGPAEAGAWTLHSGITEEAPIAARRARVSFGKGIVSTLILVDDVLFFKSE
jgi:hypothetical protein